MKIQPPVQSRSQAEPDEGMFTLSALPNDALRQDMEYLVLDEGILKLGKAWASQLVSQNFQREAWGVHGILLMEGPPGTAKTTFALGLADHMARGVQSARGLPSLLIQVKAEQVLRQELGGSVTQAKFAMQIAHSHSIQQWVILLIDDAECLLISRELIANHPGEPLDPLRVVDVFLAGFDQLARTNSAIIVVSNMVDKLDSAIRDRIDMRLRFALPDKEQRLAIIAARLQKLGATGLKIELDGRQADELSQATKCLSGRQLSKLPFAALCHSAKTPDQLSAADLIAVSRSLSRQGNHNHA